MTPEQWDAAATSYRDDTRSPDAVTGHPMEQVGTRWMTTPDAVEAAWEALRGDVDPGWHKVIMGHRPLIEAALVARSGGLDYEEMRVGRGWPTPNHMRRTADAIDSLTPAKYGDVLRWFADLCDAALSPEPEPS